MQKIRTDRNALTLSDLIAARIREHGPITIADYMGMALSHPEHGYYMRKDPLGVQGDFITSPEISQVFGEVIGAWLATQWQALSRPEAALIELGPGRGTLMADMLRATRIVSGFHDALTISLIETSPALKQKQWQALAGKHEGLSWQESIDPLPDLPLLVVANEFFDALPIRQFVRKKDSWQERMIGVDAKGALEFTTIAAKAGMQKQLNGHSGDFYEYNEATESVARALARHIKKFGGAALLIDYGYETGKRADTLQAVRAHQFHDPLIEPGTADLTAHVDFSAIKTIAIAEGCSVYGPTAQGAFLGRLGAIPRAVRLCEGLAEDKQAVIMSGLERLISPDQMGERFRVMAITSPDLPKPEGF